MADDNKPAAKEAKQSGSMMNPLDVFADAVWNLAAKILVGFCPAPTNEQLNEPAAFKDYFLLTLQQTGIARADDYVKYLSTIVNRESNQTLLQLLQKNLRTIISASIPTYKKHLDTMIHRYANPLVESYRSQLATLTTESEAKHKEQLAAMAAEKEKSLAALKALNAHMAAELKTAKAQADKAQHELEQEKAKISERLAELDAQRAALAKEHNRITEEHRELQQQLATLRQDQATATNTRGELNTLRNTLQQLQAKLASDQANLTPRERKLEEQETAVKLLRAQLTTEVEDYKLATRQLATERKAAATEAQTAAEATKKQLAMLTERYAELQAIKDAARREYDQLNARSSASIHAKDREIAEFQQRQKILEDEIKRLHTALTAKEKEFAAGMTELRDTLAKTQEAEKVAQQKIDQLMTDSTLLRQQQIVLYKTTVDLSVSLTSAEQRSKQLSAELSALQQQKIALEKEATQLHDSLVLERQQRRTELASTELSTLREKISSLEKEIQQLHLTLSLERQQQKQTSLTLKQKNFELQGLGYALVEKENALAAEREKFKHLNVTLASAQDDLKQKHAEIGRLNIALKEAHATLEAEHKKNEEAMRRANAIIARDLSRARSLEAAQKEHTRNMRELAAGSVIVHHVPRHT